MSLCKVGVGKVCKQCNNKLNFYYGDGKSEPSIVQLERNVIL